MLPSSAIKSKYCNKKESQNGITERIFHLPKARDTRLNFESFQVESFVNCMKYIITRGEGKHLKQKFKFFLHISYPPLVRSKFDYFSGRQIHLVKRKRRRTPPSPDCSCFFFLKSVLKIDISGNVPVPLQTPAMLWRLLRLRSCSCSTGVLKRQYCGTQASFEWNRELKQRSTFIP